MVIRQGEIYWVDVEFGSRRPHVVIQNDTINASRINSVIMCELTTKLRRANAPGNVLLDQGEANLPKASVVNVSQIFTVDKANLGDWIGILARNRVDQILGGVWFMLEPSRWNNSTP
jgi:mRNA interferase MazF